MAYLLFAGLAGWLAFGGDILLAHDVPHFFAGSLLCVARRGHGQACVFQATGLGGKRFTSRAYLLTGPQTSIIKTQTRSLGWQLVVEEKFGSEKRRWGQQADPGAWAFPHGGLWSWSSRDSGKGHCGLQ